MSRAKDILKFNPEERVGWVDGDVIVYACAFAAQKTHWSLPVLHHPIGVPTPISWVGKKEANAFCDSYDVDKSHLDGLVVAEPVSHAHRACKMLLAKIKKGTQADKLVVFLTGKGNYREDIYPDYKANRKAAKPEHYEAMRDYLRGKHHAITINGMEADDAMGIAQVASHKLIERWKKGRAERNGGVSTDRSVICTIDKDLNMIRGWHYNWQKDELDYVATGDGDRFFYTQLLMGDSTDNIKGIPKMGEKGAAAIMAEVPRSARAPALYDRVREEYTKHWKERLGTPVHPADVVKRADKDLLLNARLLWILREKGVQWTPPEEK